MDELETLVLRLEADTLDLDAAVEAYAQGVALARYCLGRLQDAESRIQHLTLEDNDDDA